MPIIEGQLPASAVAVWQHFYYLTQTPRPSKEEQAALAYVKAQAEVHGCDWQQDIFGNVVVYVVAKGAGEGKAPVAIQNHIDMVTVAEAHKAFDFRDTPLDIRIGDEWLQADGTTLGADNGLGCAAALALLDNPPENHPPLELLFTTEEEIGLLGAAALDTNMLSAKRLLNLDSEEWGSAYIGCAGGLDYKVQSDFVPDELYGDEIFYQINVHGFKGGHSGIDIHRERVNASIFLLALLDALKLSWKWITFEGGQANNVIPRSALAQIAVSRADEDLLKQQLAVLFKFLKEHLGADDQAVRFKAKPVIVESLVALSPKDSKALLKKLKKVPHGVHTYYQMDDEAVISCSNNLGLLSLGNAHLEMTLLFRFMQDDDKTVISKHCQNLTKLGFECQLEGTYPNWPVANKSALKQQLDKTYQQLFEQPVAWKTIHAGLECGLLCEKIPDLDVVSFGPTIENAHSPSERVNIASVSVFWQLLCALLDEIAQEESA